MNINLVVEDFIQEYALMKVLQNTSQAYEPGLIFGKKGKYLGEIDEKELKS